MFRLKMTSRDPHRTYPKAYERMLPWILGGVLVCIVIFIVVIILVLLGLFP